jgi:hypothetical protein
MTRSLKGLLPESWLCVDCGINTAPGLLNRVEMEKAFARERAQAASSRRIFHATMRSITVKCRARRD